MIKRMVLLPLFLLLATTLVRGERRVPSVEDLLQIASIGGTQISPDGKRVAYTVTQADFYLGDDPADDPEIYEKTSPMSYILKASTPTLIQHGEFDRRVPIPNGYELRQGLEDRGVPVEMVVYKGFGHGIDKPRSQRAVMWHNLVWFNHYLWGDALPELAKPDVPEKK